MKIYDCITYCGENLLLKIRFETLYDKVDKFIIVEANKYFDGNPKPKLFNIENFEKSVFFRPTGLYPKLFIIS